MTTLASAACGSLVGALAGFFLIGTKLLWGISANTAQVVSGVAGLVVGFCFFYLYVLWMFNARLGRFKIVLMTVESEQSVPAKAEARPAVGGGAHASTASRSIRRNLHPAFTATTSTAAAAGSCGRLERGGIVGDGTGNMPSFASSAKSKGDRVAFVGWMFSSRHARRQVLQQPEWLLCSTWPDGPSGPVAVFRQWPS